MSQIITTRTLEFDAGHRVLGHEGKCAHLHGHRYKVNIGVSATELDELGRTIDFSVIKRVAGGWIDDNWDHNMILNAHDPMLHLENEADVIDPAYICGRTPYVMSHNRNPTAENMAVELYEILKGLFPAELTITYIKMWETPNCFSVFIPD